MKSFTAIIKKGEEQFVSLCPELDVVSQGYTIEESLANLKEAVELYLEEMGVPEDFLKKRHHNCKFRGSDKWTNFPDYRVKNLQIFYPNKVSKLFVKKEAICS